MKNKVLVFISVFLLSIFLLGSYKGNTETYPYEKAKIISANYQNHELVVFLEINHSVYKSKFKYDLTQDDYMYLHHNSGAFIEVVYQINLDNELVIYEWKITDYFLK